MAYIDRSVLQTYPFHAYFYRVVIDDSLPLDQQVPTRQIIYQTECDITESSHSWSRNFIWAKYAVYFPFDKDAGDIKIRLGDMFEAEVYGVQVNGKVVGVFPSQMGGVTVYVQDTDV